jgi:hypothetical protein
LKARTTLLQSCPALRISVCSATLRAACPGMSLSAASIEMGGSGDSFFCAPPHPAASTASAIRNVA